MAVFVVYECFRQRYVPMDLAILFLFQGLLICAIIDFHTNEQYMYWLHWAWVLPLGYLLGKVVALGQDSAKKIVLAFGCLAAGMFCQGVLDFSYDYVQNGYWATEKWMQFWIHTEYQPRTTFELEWLFTTSLTFYALYYMVKVNSRKLWIYLVLACQVIIQFFCFKTEGRTNAAYLIIVVAFGILLYTYDCYKEKKKKELHFLIGLVTVAAVAVLVFMIAFKLNVGGLYDKYENSYLSGSGGIIKNVRFRAIAEAIVLLSQNHLGGFTGTVLKGGRSHNMWLEYARQYGLVPFASLYAFKLVTVIYAIRLIIHRHVGKKIRYILLPAFVCVNLYYTMEPNGHAYRNFWLFGLFLCGIISGILRKEKIDETSV